MECRFAWVQDCSYFPNNSFSIRNAYAEKAKSQITPVILQHWENSLSHGLCHNTGGTLWKHNTENYHFTIPFDKCQSKLQNNTLS